MSLEKTVRGMQHCWLALEMEGATDQGQEAPPEAGNGEEMDSPCNLQKEASPADGLSQTSETHVGLSTNIYSKFVLF